MIHDYVKCHQHFALISTAVFDVVMWKFGAIALAFATRFFVIIFKVFIFISSFVWTIAVLLFFPLSWKIWKNLAVPSVVSARKFHDESLFDDLFFRSICFVFSARSAPFVSQWFQCERNRIFWKTIYHCFMFKPEWKSHEYTRIEYILSIWIGWNFSAGCVVSWNFVKCSSALEISSFTAAHAKWHWDYIGIQSFLPTGFSTWCIFLLLQ